MTETIDEMAMRFAVALLGQVADGGPLYCLHPYRKGEEAEIDREQEVSALVRDAYLLADRMHAARRSGATDAR